MHLEVITSRRRRIFEKLRKFPEYYLTGGTALALQIGHRISVDFDLFSKKEIPKSLLPKIKRVFKGFKVKGKIVHPEQLSVEIDKTRIDFVKYNFPLLLRPIKFEGIKIARILEIAAMKAFTLSYRGAFKDYVDLYFILKNKHATLEEIKKMAEKTRRNIKTNLTLDYF